ncbi:hypothetical protein Pint_00545 [Pistacia integerrima]|uniref:Uncharacterized protein n=1 Tax=Pistacia integerrima TaxID=434235 RepID=A0ACC0ZM28_9ROSI|nr:hypothetical protein Pint_00545 [Pistacia integerrima]
MANPKIRERVQESRREVILEENGLHNDHSLQPDASALLELNLIMMVLSLSSASDDDCLNFVEERKNIVRDNEARLHTKRKDTNEVKFARRAPPRLQAIKDLR